MVDNTVWFDLFHFWFSHFTFPFFQSGFLSLAWLLDLDPFLIYSFYFSFFYHFLICITVAKGETSFGVTSDENRKFNEKGSMVFKVITFMNFRQSSKTIAYFISTQFKSSPLKIRDFVALELHRNVFEELEVKIWIFIFLKF